MKAQPSCSSKLSDVELKKILSPEQYKIVRENGTEAPFQNAYWDKKEPGIYVDVVSKVPLFSSKDKFDSGTGWPSFTRPIEEELLIEKTDKSHGAVRTEVRSKKADSHLGHLFPDGPSPTHLRYCINSASLEFIPLSQLESKGFLNELYTFEKEDYLKAKLPPVEYALLAAGCFWGVEELIRKVPGVLDVVVGYTGGVLETPTYEFVKTGTTGHAESVLVKFDPLKVTYAEILKLFFKLHDPTTLNRQGGDQGTQYRSAIFSFSETQLGMAKIVKDEVSKSGKWKNPLVTEITRAKRFWPAEDFHQDYLQKNPGGYTCHYWRD